LGIIAFAKDLPNKRLIDTQPKGISATIPPADLVPFPVQAPKPPLFMKFGNNKVNRHIIKNAPIMFGFVTLAIYCGFGLGFWLRMNGGRDMWGTLSSYKGKEMKSY
jgi:hypothetical protein